MADWLVIVSALLAIMIALLIRMVFEARRNLDVIAALCRDMKRWGDEEDGIPEAFWEDYRAGIELVGVAGFPPIRVARAEAHAQEGQQQ